MLFNILGIIGCNSLFITPLTLVMGIIHAIKKLEKEALQYKVITVISAYLIVFAFVFLSLK